VVADFENTKRFRRRGRLWGPLHADVCLFALTISDKRAA
jgi:hypothetical protein